MPALSLCCCLTCWHWVCAAQSRVLAQSLCCHVVLTQDCAHRVLFVSGSVTGTSPTNSLSGLASLQTLGNNNFSSVSPGVTTNGLGGTSAPSGMDALSQAYSGIQQYAGLSSLLSPAGKGWWIFFYFRSVAAVLFFLCFDDSLLTETELSAPCHLSQADSVPGVF